jgi:hypothetical protein
MFDILLVTGHAAVRQFGRASLVTMLTGSARRAWSRRRVREVRETAPPFSVHSGDRAGFT